MQYFEQLCQRIPCCWEEINKSDFPLPPVFFLAEYGQEIKWSLLPKILPTEKWK